MDIHKIAKLTPQSRADVVGRVVDQGQSPAAVAAAVGVCARTVRKWVARYRAEGADGLLDRSSRPHRQPRALPAAVASKSWRCAGTAGVEPRSPPRCTCLPPPSVGSSAARVSSGWPPSTRRRPFAFMNIRIPATCCTSISRNSAVLAALDTALPMTAATPVRPHAEAPEHRDMGVSAAHQDEVLDHGDGLRVHRTTRASTREIARSKRAGSGNRLTIRNASRGKSKK